MTTRLPGLVLLTSLCLVRSGLPEPPDVSSHFRRVVVEPGQSVKEITCTGCSVEIRGVAQGDVITFGGNVLLTGSARGDVITIGGSVHLLPRAFIDGDAIALAGSVQQDPGSKISGEADSFRYLHLPGQRGLQAAGVLTFFCVNMSLVVLSGLILRRQRTDKLADALSSRPLTAAAAGLSALALGSLLIILPGISHLWAVALTGVAALVMLALFLPGYAGVNLVLGGFLLRNRRRIVTLSAGALLTTALQLIPVVGFFVMISLLISALGSSVLSRLGSYPREEPGQSAVEPLP